MMAEESKNSDTTRFDMRPVTPDRAGSSGLGILLVFMMLAVPALIAITFLMKKPSEVPGERVPESTDGFFKDVPIEMPLGLVAPEEHPAGLVVEALTGAPDEMPGEIEVIDRPQKRASQKVPLFPWEQPEPEWKREIREQMQKRISFDFVDTPLADVVAFLTNLTNMGFVLDPQSVEGGVVPITLKVRDMKLEVAIEWVLRLAGLSYALTDSFIYIATPERLQELPSVRDKQIVFRT